MENSLIPHARSWARVTTPCWCPTVVANVPAIAAMEPPGSDTLTCDRYLREAQVSVTDALPHVAPGEDVSGRDLAELDEHVLGPQLHAHGRGHRAEAGGLLLGRAPDVGRDGDERRVLAGSERSAL